MTKGKEFFHADQVGSMLRPEALLKAWAAHEAGDMTDAELLARQDEAIGDAIRAQEALGFRCIVDGEFRRDVGGASSLLRHVSKVSPSTGTIRQPGSTRIAPRATCRPMFQKEYMSSESSRVAGASWVTLSTS